MEKGGGGRGRRGGRCGVRAGAGGRWMTAMALLIARLRSEDLDPRTRRTEGGGGAAADGAAERRGTANAEGRDIRGEGGRWEGEQRGEGEGSAWLSNGRHGC